MIFKHIDGVIVKADFSKCGKFRYKLEVENPKCNGTDIICVIMQNPSVANEDIADKSVQFLEKLIFQKNYKEFSKANRLIIVNQFAYVKTNEFNGSSEHIGERNDEAIESAVKSSDIVLIAWGSRNGYEDRKSFIHRILSNYPAKVLLKSKSHPSRGSYTDFVLPYSI